MSDYCTPSDWMETPNAGKLRGVDPYAEWKKIQRTAEMQCAVMADPERTGGWPGAQKVSDAFADLAERVHDVAEAATSQITSLIEEREMLREALKPFADAGGMLPLTFGPDNDPVSDDEEVTISCVGYSLGEVTAADLSRAYFLLSPATAEGRKS